jgi:hypothetical protein
VCVGRREEAEVVVRLVARVGLAEAAEEVRHLGLARTHEVPQEVRYLRFLIRCELGSVRGDPERDGLTATRP